MYIYAVVGLHHGLYMFTYIYNKPNSSSASITLPLQLPNYDMCISLPANYSTRWMISYNIHLFPNLTSASKDPNLDLKICGPLQCAFCNLLVTAASYRLAGSLQVFSGEAMN